MTNSFGRTVALFFGIFLVTPILRGQQPTGAKADGPKACIEFGEMALRADQVINQEFISEEAFRRAYKDPEVVVRNPEKAFSVGSVEYFTAESDGKIVFVMSVTRNDKRADFLKWYNGGGKEKLLSVGMNCVHEYNRDVRESKNSSQQNLLQTKSEIVWTKIVEANQFAQDGLGDALQAALKYVDAQTVQIAALQERYNALVGNVNAYNIAVDKYITTTNRLVSEQKVSAPAPRLNFNFSRPQPIICTGDTMGFSNSTAYISGTSTLTSATTTIHCE